jgi:hypothetical protein
MLGLGISCIPEGFTVCPEAPNNNDNNNNMMLMLMKNKNKKRLCNNIMGSSLSHKEIRQAYPNAKASSHKGV